LKSIKQYLLFFIGSFLWTISLAQDRVGLVLSGGGASGLAHVGVLKALEEKGIPIDFITGTSAGALVGSMYAAGYSPEEIEVYILSEAFQLMAAGKLRSNQRFTYKEEDLHAGLIDLSFSRDSILKKSLPTNFISSSYLDFEMLKILGITGASKGNDFNNLFVPFRCVASDIVLKKSVVFSKGDLNQAVRASMTYPFYLNPIRIENVLYFDGGLYNNFPADVMYQDFDPDFIIGSNVSINAMPPMENDLISQVTNMLVAFSDFNLPCEEGILIQPDPNLATFDFENAATAIKSGYDETIKKIDIIYAHVQRRVSKEELTIKRLNFRANIRDIAVSSITSNLNRKKDITFAEKSLLNNRKKEIIDLEKLEKRYYRLYASDQIDFIYPILQLKKDSTYNLELEIRKAKDFKLDVGGHFSSRAVNTGYLGITYRTLGKAASSFHASSYFGKFYGSGKLSYTMEIPAAFKISASTYFVLNRWDYFRSFSNFFEDVKPSFLVQNEMYYGLKLNRPIGNTTKSSLDFRIFSLEDDYYQTENFTNKDTSDITLFKGSSVSWEFVKNSLNRKQFSSAGHYFRLKVRYVNGYEKSIPGSTSFAEAIQEKNHQWFNITSEFQSFLINNSIFHLGIHGNGMFTSQSLFSNYTASLLSMTSFSLLPDAETYFLPEYRSPQYVSGGLNLIFSLRKYLDIRLDAYYFQPFVILQKNADGTPSYSKLFKGNSFIGSTSLIYHSIIGPIRATLNYFPKQLNPFAFQISYGFILFNERAVR
jgi:NTE family protein